jgi:amidohydrolase
MNNAINRLINQHRELFADISREIHANPELCYQEHRAAKLLSDALERAGLRVERRLYGIDTAFRATLDRGPGPSIAILAEYDALPEIGHACGHNLIGTGAIAAAVGLTAAEFSGNVVVLGTPAEEGGGGKIKLIQSGAFDGIDAAMMYHPLDRDILTNPALAMSHVILRFDGKASHAAAAPWDGSSALSAVLQTFQLIDNARLHMRDGVRIHGIITNGGKAINIIPEEAEAQFSVRAPTSSGLEVVLERVHRCASAAALATGCTLHYTENTGYQNLKDNQTMVDVFGRHLSALGRHAPLLDPSMGAGSTDMGDVSQVVPSIHPYIAICEKGAAMCHQRSFTEHAASETAIDAMLLAAKAMAQTTFSLLQDASLLQQVKTEFGARTVAR